MNKKEFVETIENEFSAIENTSSWNKIYSHIKSEGQYDYGCSIARSSTNKRLNRYTDVLPYDHSRIILQENSVDYINASLVVVEAVNRKYILCQGPLSHTLSHFWLMIWQQKTKAVVMLNKLIEKDQIKCSQYWPVGSKKGGEDLEELPSVKLKIELIKEISHKHYIYRSFKLTNTETEESREILHFHYTTWPDFGVPNSPSAFFEFLSVVRESKCLEEQYGPAVVHCSAGIGRSGTFCLVDSVLKMITDEKFGEKRAVVLDLLLEMRKFRMGLIQTADQLKFSYQAIMYGARKLDDISKKDPLIESSSEEPSMEEPPPLPPPRLDSLTRSSLIVANNNCDTDSDDMDDLDEDLKDNSSELYQRNSSPSDDLEDSLPDVPEKSTSSEASLANCPSIVDDKSELSDRSKLRKRQDRIASTSAKIKDIKEKAAASEDWQERKDILLSPISICTFLLVVGVGTGIMYYRQF